MPETKVRRWALLLPVGAILIMSLLACQSPSRGNIQPGSTSLALATPADGSASAMPTFAPFTIGAWPSNSMPGTRDQVTVYVICRMQDPTMLGYSTPAAQLKVVVQVLDPIDRTYVGTTSSAGIASVRIAFSGARSGKPILVNVSAMWQRVTYHGQTTFTPAPQGQPRAPSGDGSSRHGRHRTPTPTPQSGPPPKPTPTPKPTPSPPPKPGVTPTP